MKILITGNLGYVGPAVVAHLRRVFPDAHLAGYDAGYFAHCITGAELFAEAGLSCQHYGDVRDLSPRFLEGFDAIVHLAAISNDPMGNRFEKITEAINHQASANIGSLAARCGVGRFVFASSCSIYGYAEEGARKESDPLNPLTAYARSKVETEKSLQSVGGNGLIVTALRFATACGMSPRLRLDLVLNDFVASAVATNRIVVLSDGTPWRPLINIADMARAIEWALVRDPGRGGRFLAVNVGTDRSNVQIGDLARTVANLVPGTSVSVNRDAPPDKRSYRVDFSLYRDLAPRHQPQVTLEQSVEELRVGLQRMRFADAEFRSSTLMRLKALEQHIASARLDSALRWT
jgi:nucleoside-diphosphate-sugar epimerase